MQSLANCPRCGNVFVKSLREICPSCYKEEEEAFKIVYQFLKKQQNREATIREIVEATEVEEELVIKFVKEKRLRTSQFPKLAYPCDKCGEQITSGKICPRCSTGLLKALETHDAILAKKEGLKEEQTKANTYFTLDHQRKK